MSNNIDIVVIGSGVAGALVAKELSKAGLQVCILEAGDAWSRSKASQKYHNSVNRILTAPFKEASWMLSPYQKDYFSNQGNPKYKPTFIKGVGGTTWSWTGITPRFLPADFEIQSRYGIGIDWPIQYNDIEPYYTQAENTLGVAGDSTNDHGSPRSKPYPMSPIPISYSDQIIAKGLASKGLKVAPFPAARNSTPFDNRPVCQGNNTCSPLCPTGAQYSADTDIKKAVAYGAKLIKKAVAFQFDIDKNHNIKAVHYKHPDASQHVIKAKKFIIACNAIETPRLLLMSESEQCPNGVANSSGQVGKNLMDHSIHVWKFHMPTPVYLGRGPQSISTILHGRDGTFRKEYAAAKLFLGNDLNIHVEAAQLLKDDKNWLSLLDKLKAHAISQAQIGIEVEQLPLEENQVCINKHRLDPLGLPLPFINYKLHPYTQKGVNIWKEYVKSLIQHLNADIISSSSSLSSHHMCGTTRMGNQRHQSVVNKHCQSHDHQNLYIIGGSVFPTQGTANPTLTIAALSLRLAKHIIDKERI